MNAIKKYPKVIISILLLLVTFCLLGKAMLYVVMTIIAIGMMFNVWRKAGKGEVIAALLLALAFAMITRNWHFGLVALLIELSFVDAVKKEAKQQDQPKQLQ